MTEKLPDHRLCHTVDQIAVNFKKVADITVHYKQGLVNCNVPLTHCMDETYLNQYMQIARDSSDTLRAYGNTFSFTKEEDFSVMNPDEALGVSGAPLVFAVVSKVIDDTDGFTTLSWPWLHKSCNTESFHTVVGLLISGGNKCIEARTKDIATDCRPNHHCL